MKSWLSFLLSDDEYRERKTLYFLAEGSVILLLYLIGIFIINRFIPSIQLDLEFSLFIAIWIFIGYILLRYIISGMEYTDISTEQAYNNQFKIIIKKSCGFAIIFNLVYLFFIFPNKSSQLFEIIAISIIGGFFLFFVEYISLKRSYKKNKDLF